jgi:hypothetical protein
MRKNPTVAMVEAIESRRLLSTGPLAGPVQAAAEPLPQAVVGQQFGSMTLSTSLELAAIINVDPQPLGQDLPQAVVRWGDGSRPTRIDTLPDTAGRRIVAQVSGPNLHTYARPGKFPLRVTFIYHHRVLARTAEVVRAAFQTPGGRELHERPGTPFTDVLGTFEDNYFAPISTTIDWGDGKHSAGTFRLLHDNLYQVSGSHTYAKVGTYRVQVTAAEGPPAGYGIGAPDVFFVVIDSTIVVSRQAKR